jgi:hypothetical protein
MSNISTAIRYLAAASPNPDLIDLNEASGADKPYARKDNADFLADVAVRLARRAAPASRKATRQAKRDEKPKPAGAKAKKSSGGTPAAESTPEPARELQVAPDGVVAIGLLGQYGQLGYALRRAQEVIRIDRSPSYWSHAFLFLDPISKDASRNRDPATAPRVLEATLHPGQTPGELFAFRNGVNVRRFSDYARASFAADAPPAAPNIAVLSFGLTPEERKAIRDRATRPEADLLSYDLPHLIGTWFHFALSLGKRSNPLVEGIGMPSASFLQLAYDAAGIDLSPGSSDRNSAPEHLWQAARFLHVMFEAPGPDGTLQGRPLLGYHCVREPNCLVAPADVVLPSSFDAFVNQG